MTVAEGAAPRPLHLGTASVSEEGARSPSATSRPRSIACSSTWKPSSRTRWPPSPISSRHHLPEGHSAMPPRFWLPWPERKMPTSSQHREGGGLPAGASVRDGGDRGRAGVGNHLFRFGLDRPPQRPTHRPAPPARAPPLNGLELPGLSERSPTRSGRNRGGVHLHQEAVGPRRRCARRGGNQPHRPVPWLGSTTTGKWVNHLEEGTDIEIEVFRAGGLEGTDAALAEHQVLVPPSAMYSAARRNSSIVALKPRLRRTGFLDFPTSRGGVVLHVPGADLEHVRVTRRPCRGGGPSMTSRHDGEAVSSRAYPRGASAPSSRSPGSCGGRCPGLEGPPRSMWPRRRGPPWRRRGSAPRSRPSMGRRMTMIFGRRWRSRRPPPRCLPASSPRPARLRPGNLLSRKSLPDRSNNFSKGLDSSIPDSVRSLFDSLDDPAPFEEVRPRRALLPLDRSSRVSPRLYSWLHSVQADRKTQSRKSTSGPRPPKRSRRGWSLGRSAIRKEISPRSPGRRARVHAPLRKGSRAPDPS